MLRTLEGHNEWVGHIAFDPTGRTLASASEDTTIKLWDTASGKLLRTLEGHGKWVNSNHSENTGKGNVNQELQVEDGCLEKQLEKLDKSGSMKNTLTFLSWTLLFIFAACAMYIAWLLLLHRRQ